jgi:hypothetical protein
MARNSVRPPEEPLRERSADRDKGSDETFPLSAGHRMTLAACVDRSNPHI